MMTMTNQAQSQQAFLPPLALVDLDDTLFQTHNRIAPDNSYRVATFDKQQQPLSYMSPTQWQFVQWLFNSAHVVAITARSVEALSRVQLDFNYGAVCSHGGAVLNPDKTLDQEWQAHMTSELSGYQARLLQLVETVTQLAPQLGSIRTWVVEEQDLGLYVVVKQNQSEHLYLKDLLNLIPKEQLDGFYFHINGNNLALIPNPVSKANATEFLLKKHQTEHRPILGFGDSLSDVGFLSQCQWWGMPQKSQLNRWVNHALTTQYTKEGYYGDYQ